MTSYSGGGGGGGGGGEIQVTPPLCMKPRTITQAGTSWRSDSYILEHLKLPGIV